MEVYAEVLISLVEAKPVLWAKSLEIYKDRNATRKAWEEVCLALNPDLENNSNGKKNAFGKEVIKQRWTNLRDCFAKSKKDDKSAKKSESKAKKRKKCVFTDQLQFLNKINTEKDTVDSLNPEIVPGTLEEDEEPEGTTGEPEVSTNVNLPSKLVGTRKRKKLDEVELKMLKALEPKAPCSKMFFLQSLMPHLTNYSNSEFLQFKVRVLNVIENINKLKETPHPQSNYPSSVPSYQPPPQYMLQPSPVNQPQHLSMFNNLHLNLNNMQILVFGQLSK